jgi:hypothetical protein
MTPSGDRRPVAGAMFFLAFVSALVSMIATDAMGVNMDMIPSVRLHEEWQSNVFGTTTNEVSSFGTRLTPGLAFKFTSADNVMLQISGSYEKVWYYNAEARNADYDTWFFRVESTGGWKLTPTFSVLPSVYYVNTTNSYRSTQLVPTGDPVVSPVTITNYGKTKTQDFGGGVGFDYLSTPNLTLGISVKYSEQRFPGDNVAGSGLTNAAQTGGTASVSYLFSPRTSFGITAGGEHQTYENNPDSDVLSGGILFGHQFSPGFRFDANLGISRIRQKEAPGTPAENKISPSGTFNVAYTSVTFTAGAFGSYTYSGGSGFGEATRQWTTGLVFGNRFSREWSGNLSGAYQVSRSAFDTAAVDLATFYGTAGLQYQPWEWGSLDLTGNMNRQTSDGQFGETLNSYSALLGITIGKPYKIF